MRSAELGVRAEARDRVVIHSQRRRLHARQRATYRRSMSRRPYPRLATLGAVLVAIILLSGSAKAADIHGDDDADRYVGTGGLVLPGPMSQSVREEVAGCEGCSWRLSSPCVTSDAGNPFSGTPTCTSVVRGCPQVAEHLRAWFRPASGEWRELGMVCIGDEGPTTVVGLTADVREWMNAQLPPLRPRHQPARGIVTQIPVVFDSGQKRAGLSVSVDLGADTVHLQAVPGWRWDFDDGVRLTTDHPGGTYPETGVAHAFRTAGDYLVRVVTTWAATFTVDGLGPFTVAEPVSQSATLRALVGEGRAVLTTR